MEYILKNTVEDKILGVFTEQELVHKVREIAIENEDEELSIIKIGEALDYIETYCDNLTVTEKKSALI